MPLLQNMPTYENEVDQSDLYSKFSSFELKSMFGLPKVI